MSEISFNSDDTPVTPTHTDQFPLRPPEVQMFEGTRPRSSLATIVPCSGEGTNFLPIPGQEDARLEPLTIMGAIMIAAAMLSKASSVVGATQDFLTGMMFFKYDSFENHETRDHVEYGPISDYTTLEKFKNSLLRLYHHEDIAEHLESHTFDPSQQWPHDEYGTDVIQQELYDGCFWLNSVSTMSPLQSLGSNAAPISTIKAGILSVIARVFGLLMCENGPISRDHKLYANHHMIGTRTQVTAARLAFGPDAGLYNSGFEEDSGLAPTRVNEIFKELTARLQEFTTTLEYSLPQAAWETRYGHYNCSSYILVTEKLEHSYRCIVKLIVELAGHLDNKTNAHTLLNFLIVDLCAAQEMAGACPTLTAAMMMLLAVTYEVLSEHSAVLTWWPLDRALVTRCQFLERRFTQTAANTSHRTPLRRLVSGVADLFRGTPNHDDLQPSVDHYSIAKTLYHRAVGMLTLAARDEQHIHYMYGHEIQRDLLLSAAYTLPAQETDRW